MYLILELFTDERFSFNRDGNMHHRNSEYPHRQSLALLLAVTSLFATPLVAASPAVAAPVISAESAVSPARTSAVETPAASAIRTTTALVGVVVGAVVAVGLWWYLVIRNRRRD